MSIEKLGKKLEEAEKKIANLRDELEKSDGERAVLKEKLENITRETEAHEALKESEMKYSTLVERSPDGIVMIQGNSFVFVNSACARMLGYFREEAKDIFIPDVVAPDCKDEVLKRYHDRMAGKDVPSRYEVKLIRKDGSTFWVEMNASLIKYKGKLADLVFIRDITDRKQAEEKLRQRLIYEQLLVRVSALAVKAKNLKRFQNECIEAMGKTLGVSRVYIFEHDHETDTMDNTFEWVADGVTPQKEFLQNVRFEDFPWWVNTLKAGKVINYSDIENIPDEGTRAIFRRQGILSILVVPLFVGDRYFGFIGFDECKRYREWLPEDVDLLQAASRIIAGVLQRKMEEEKLEEANRITKISPSVAFTWKNSEGWPVEFVSENVRKIFGYSAQEFISGKILYEKCIHPDDLSRVAHEVEKYSKGNEKEFTHKPYRIVTKNGNIKWVSDWTYIVRDKEGNITHYKGIIQDITEKKQYEAWLNLLTSVIKQTSEMVIIADRQGYVQYANPSFEKITGYSAEEITGKDFCILKYENRDSEFCRRVQATVNNKKTWVGKIENKKKDGTVYLEFATIFPILDSKGEITHYAKIARDITDEVRIQGYLQQAQKMEAIGRLAGGIAHDFKNILTGIMLSTDMAIGEADPGSQIGEYLSDIKDASETGSNLVKQLLAFCRKQELSPVVLDVNDVIDKISGLISRLIGENIDLRTVPGTDLPPIKMDKAQLERILLNLSVNARDAMPDGGKLIFRTSLEEIDEELRREHPFFDRNRYVVLSVIDTGTGMDEETLSHIFEPFFTTKSKSKGTGLGLSTVYGIVKQSGGYIDVKSEPGKGTAFRIYFPTASYEEKPEKKKEQEIQLEEKVGKYILAVDDEKMILKLLKKVLTKAGYKVYTARTAKEALSKFNQHREDICLLLADVGLPDQKGTQLARQIKEKKPSLGVILTSGYSESDFSGDIHIEEEFEFIEKPFKINEILKKINSIIGSPITEKQ